MELIKRLQSGRHCAAFCGTKAFADKVYKRVKQALPDLPVLYYSRDTPGKKKEEDLADVNSSWVLCSLLLYTSTLLVGVRKNMICIDGHFQACHFHKHTQVHRWRLTSCTTKALVYSTAVCMNKCAGALP